MRGAGTADRTSGRNSILCAVRAVTFGSNDGESQEKQIVAHPVLLGDCPLIPRIGSRIPEFGNDAGSARIAEAFEAINTDDFLCLGPGLEPKLQIFGMSWDKSFHTSSQQGYNIHSKYSTSAPLCDAVTPRWCSS